MDDLRTDITQDWMPPVAPTVMPVQALDRPYRDVTAPEGTTASFTQFWRVATFLPAFAATGALIAAFTDWFAMDGFSAFEGVVIGLIAFTFFWIALSVSTALLGVKGVIAETYERIHRSNLVGMGVIPFEFTGGDTRKSLGLTGDETVSISGLDAVTPLQEMEAVITMADGTEKTITVKCRIDTAVEIEYIENGGVLHYVLRNLAKAA